MGIRNWFRRRRVRKKTDADHKVFSADYIAEQLGMFPSEVEETLKDLHQQGIIEVYWYEEQMYAIVPKDFDPSQLKAKRDIPGYR